MIDIVNSIEIQNKLKNQGYAIFKNTINKSDCKDLITLYKKEVNTDLNHFYASLFLDNEVLKDNISNKISGTIFPYLKEVFSNYEPLVGNFIVKPAKSKSLGFHQDWSIVNEGKGSHINIWCSLNDSDNEVEKVILIPKSHLLPSIIRTYGRGFDFKQIDDLIRRNEKVIELKQGDIIIWEGSLIHAFSSNETNTELLSTTLICIPKDMTPMFYFKDKENKLEQYIIQKQFFSNYSPGERPQKYAELNKTIENEELDVNYLKKQWSNIVDSQLPIELLYNGCKVLKDIKLDTIENLKKLYKKYTDNKLNGFYTSLNMPFIENRVLLFNEFCEILNPVIEKHFPDYEILMTNFVIKTKGENSLLPLHIDWSVVDERKRTSLGLWIPLQDVKEENGTLSLLEKSHKFGYTVRGSIVNFIATDKKLNAGILESLNTTYKKKQFDLKEGEAVLYDLRIAHSSNPNRTDKPRIAINLILVEKKAQTFHYKLNPKGEVEVHKVNRDFFKTLNLSKSPNNWNILIGCKAQKLIKFNKIEEQFQN